MHSRTPTPALTEHPAMHARAAIDPWSAAFDHARQTGQSEEQARDFADEYAAFVEDRQLELRSPDLPIPSPNEYALRLDGSTTEARSGTSAR